MRKLIPAGKIVTGFFPTIIVSCQFSGLIPALIYSSWKNLKRLLD